MHTHVSKRITSPPTKASLPSLCVNSNSTRLSEARVDYQHTKPQSLSHSPPRGGVTHNEAHKRTPRPDRGGGSSTSPGVTVRQTVEAVDKWCEATRESNMICHITCGCRNSLENIMEKTRVVSHILRAIYTHTLKHTNHPRCKSRL